MFKVSFDFTNHSIIENKKTLPHVKTKHIRTPVKPRISARSQRMTEFIRSFWDPDFRNIFGMVIKEKFAPGERIAFQIQDQFNYPTMFPQCGIRHDLMGSLVTLNFTVDPQNVTNPIPLPTFYVKKYWIPERDRYGNLRRLVIYLAQLPSAAPPFIDSRNDLLTVRNNHRNWLAMSVCENNLFTDIRANDNVLFDDGRVLSARRCGLASVLAYLCFLDSDHLTNRKGYLIENDGIWGDDNMPQITMLGFNNEGCSRMIKADFTLLQGGRDAWLPGNKALIYGAFAARFHQLVAYNPVPCDRYGPQECCAAENRKGNCFLLEHLIDTINVRDPGADGPAVQNLNNPQQAIHFGLDNFMKHYGKIWYFCKRNGA